MGRATASVSLRGARHTRTARGCEKPRPRTPRSGRPRPRRMPPDREAAPERAGGGDSQWPLWEVFTQEADGAPHEHAGSLHAVDAEHALQNARDVYARRGKVVNIW